MSNRIHKDIGYFLMKDFHEVLVDGYDHILSQNTLTKEVLENVYNAIHNDKNKNRNGYLFVEYEARTLLSSESVLLSDFIYPVYHFDELKGIMFTTPYFKNKGRDDDYIDYYENHHDFKIRMLGVPLYPDSSYVFVKPLEQNEKLSQVYPHFYPDRKTIEVGDAIGRDTISACCGLKYKEWSAPKNNESKYIHPYINPLIYHIMREIKIIREMSYVEFITALEPAIITYWK